MTKNQRLEESQRTMKSGDRWIWGFYICLCIISLIEAYSASSQEILTQGLFKPFIKHFVTLGLGFGLLFYLQKKHYQTYIRWILPFTLLTIACLILVYFIGENVNGAQRAIPLGPFTLQPAEMAKLATALQVLWIVAKHQIACGVSNKGMWYSIIVVTIFAVLLFMQGFTNTVIMMAISVGIMIVGGIKVSKLILVGLMYALIGGGLFAYKTHSDDKAELMEIASLELRLNQNDFRDQLQRDSALARLGELQIKQGLIDEAPQTNAAHSSITTGNTKGVGRSSTWKKRIERFIANHDSLLYKPLNSENQQEMYAHFAQAHGGIIGAGPGGSRECSRLPLAFSDYIYSIIVEETGFIGGVIVLMIYLWLLIRAGIIAGQCQRAFPALLIIGMAMMITFQALIHMAINTGLFPVSGQPLPLISKGGTSILIISAGFGIMLSVSRHAGETLFAKASRKASDEGIDTSLDAANPTQWSDDNNNTSE